MYLWTLTNYLLKRIINKIKYSNMNNLQGCKIWCGRVTVTIITGSSKM